MSEFATKEDLSTLTADDVNALPISGGTMAGNVDMNGYQITGFAEPSGATQAATKNYVDTAVSDKQDALTGLTPSMVMICNSSGQVTTSSQVSTGELGYLSGVTSNIQTQLNKIHKWQGPFTGDIDSTGLNGLYWLQSGNYTGTAPDDIVTYAFLEATERHQKLIYYSSSSITKIYERYYTNDKWYDWKRTDSLDKQDAITGLTNSMVMICNANGEITTSSTISTSELANLDGVTSNIQTQLDAGYKMRGSRNSSSSVTDLNNITDLGCYWIQCSGMTNTPLPKVDNAYKIVHKYEMCAEALEKIYEDEVFEYYLPCMSSHAIYLEWNDGSTTLMIDDLKSGKVSIESLMNNGLKVYTEIK